MAIFFHEQNSKFHVKHKRNLKHWLRELILQHHMIPGDINVILQTDDELLKMNQEVLNHDTYTDIITFNYNEGHRISGDLFISIDRIKENATKFAVSTEEELHRVMAHGVLHLIGFNDKTKSEQEEMRKQESLALQLFGSMFHVKHD
ncbi:MAG: rRNA maturation RNase YbeY [Bacteroidota bacterium]|nr:rRNA maturation RNase YbeY [Bacteroidota bacterium]MDX5430358.1 rRNA maturation RNase YbeY [Bacteroidota bacterium]MDX5469119.1 rRNA maturation RNase YbeY [Bacteroidota bacterium]